MSTITLPKDLEDWARAEVAAGRAESVAAAIEQAVSKSRKWDDLCRSLDEAEAEAERDGWLDADVVFDKLEQRFSKA